MTIQSVLVARAFLNREEISSAKFLNHSSLRKHVLALSKSRKVQPIGGAESFASCSETRFRDHGSNEHVFRTKEARI